MPRRRTSGRRRRPSRRSISGNRCTPPRRSATAKRSQATARRSRPTGSVSPYPARSTANNRTPNRSSTSGAKALTSRRYPGWPWNHPTSRPSSGPGTIHPIQRPSGRITPSSWCHVTDMSVATGRQLVNHRLDLAHGLPRSSGRIGAPAHRLLVDLGKTSMEAMRCLRRRLSDVVYRQLLGDARRPSMTGPGGQPGATIQSSAVDSHRHRHFGPVTARTRRHQA